MDETAGAGEREGGGFWWESSLARAWGERGVKGKVCWDEMAVDLEAEFGREAEEARWTGEKRGAV